MQFVANLQSLNRYSYVLNNPLRYTDPTGYANVEVFPTHSTWFVGLIFTAASFACAASEGAACGLVFAVASTTFMTTAAILNGADPTQSIAMGVMSFALGYAGGAVIGSVAQSYMAAGDIAAAQMATIVGGGISSAVVSGIANSIAGQSGAQLGGSIFMAFAQGACGAAAAYGIRGMNPVSRSNAAEQQGGYSSRYVPGTRYAAASYDAIDIFLASEGHTGL